MDYILLASLLTLSLMAFSYLDARAKERHALKMKQQEIELKQLSVRKEELTIETTTDFNQVVEPKKEVSPWGNM